MRTANPTLDRIVAAWQLAPDEDRSAALATLLNQSRPPLVIKPAEAARLLSRSTRALRYYVAQGALHPVRFPGSKKRASGYLYAEVVLLAKGGLS